MQVADQKVARTTRLAPHASFLVVPLEPVESLDYDLARRKRVGTLCWERARKENRGKTWIRGRCLARTPYIRGGDDKLVDYFSSPRQTLGYATPQR